MWSFGCVLFELFTGDPLFPGESENEQIQCIMEIKGLPSDEVLSTSKRKRVFFDKNDKPILKPNSSGTIRTPNS
jgi:dual specificity tyrosine-phosphorylation-regulated kinase 2/3/4